MRFLKLNLLLAGLALVLTASCTSTTVADDSLAIEAGSPSEAPIAYVPIHGWPESN